MRSNGSSVNPEILDIMQKTDDPEIAKICYDHFSLVCPDETDFLYDFYQAASAVENEERKILKWLIDRNLMKHLALFQAR